MKRVEKLKLPFYKPGTNINITIPKKEGEELIVEYEINEDYKIKDCIMFPGDYYMIKENGEPSTTYIKFNSIDESGKIYSDVSIIIWDDDNGKIDGISLKEKEWWGDVYEGLTCFPCTEKEINAMKFLEEKYRKEKEVYKVEDWNLEVEENWDDLIL